MRKQIISKIWNGIDPYTNLPRQVYNTDFQEWNSSHEYLVQATNDKHPQIVVEIGGWKGLSHNNDPKITTE